MSFQGFEGSYFGDDSWIEVDVKLECKICWYVYDLLKGDEVWQVLFGMLFVKFFDFWCCFECDGDCDQFMVIEEQWWIMKLQLLCFIGQQMVKWLICWFIINSYLLMLLCLENGIVMILGWQLYFGV